MKYILSAGVTGVGSAYKLKSGTTIHTIQIGFTGTITALTVALKGSLDGITFFQLASYSFDAADISAKAAMFHITEKLVEYIQAEIVTLTGTGTVTICHSPADNYADAV